jgi:hypothetical protein
MDISRVAPELRAPMRRVTRIPIPMERAWGRRAIQTLLAAMPATKLNGYLSSGPRRRCHPCASTVRLSGVPQRRYSGFMAAD